MDMYFLRNNVCNSTVEIYINSSSGTYNTRVLPSEIVGIKVVDGDTTYTISKLGDNTQIPESIVSDAFTMFIKYSEWFAKTEPTYLHDPYGNVIGYTVNNRNIYYDVEYE